MSLQRNFLGALGFDPTAETTDINSEHVGGSVYDRIVRHYESREDSHEESMRAAFARMGAVCDERQRELFPEGELAKQFERIAPAKLLRVGRGDERMVLLNSRGDDEEATGEYEDWGHSRLRQEGA